MKFIPQMRVSDEEYDRLSEEASQAGMGLYDYVLNRLVGRKPALRQAQGETWPPPIETKADDDINTPGLHGGNGDAEVDGKAGRGRGRGAAERGAG
jgi:hypothetical protein